MKFAINGFGRIGRAIYRLSFNSKNDCIYINEPNAEIDDIIYFLKYDSLYGEFNSSIKKINKDTFQVSNETKKILTRVFNFNNVQDFLNNLDEECLIVESNFNKENLTYYYMHPNKKVIFTYSHEMIKDEIILGVNEEKIKKVGNIISSSICDAVAIAPILKIVFEINHVEEIIITTLHPALSYQNIVDNYVKIGLHNSLGRQYIDSLIPKKTSAEKVLNKFFGDNIKCFSYRVPTKSVCSADLTIICKNKINLKKVLEKLTENPYLRFNEDDLVSIDFKGNLASSIIDLRWLEVVNDNILKMVIWYDNEYGYSQSIIHLLDLIT